MNHGAVASPRHAVRTTSTAAANSRHDRTGLQYPTGRVYRLTAAGKLECIANNILSPNGLVMNGKESILYVAVTRANAVWRLPLLPDGTVSRMGVFILLSGGRGPDGMAIDEKTGWRWRTPTWARCGCSTTAANCNTASIHRRAKSSPTLPTAKPAACGGAPGPRSRKRVFR